MIHDSEESYECDKVCTNQIMCEKFAENANF